MQTGTLTTVSPLELLAGVMPFPVAYGVRYVMNAAQSEGRAAVVKWQCAVVAQFCQIVSLVRLAARIDRRDGTFDQELRQALTTAAEKGIRGNEPSAGVWITMAFSTRGWAGRRGNIAVRELESILDSELRGHKKTLITLVERRNKASHLDVGDAELRKWEHEGYEHLTEVLHDAADIFSQNENAIAIVRVDQVEQFENENVYTCKVLHGYSEVFAAREIRTRPDVRLLSGGVFAYHEKTGSFLRLDPLVAWSACPHCGRRRFYMAASSPQDGELWMTTPTVNCVPIKFHT